MVITSDIVLSTLEASMHGDSSSHIMTFNQGSLSNFDRICIVSNALVFRYIEKISGHGQMVVEYVR